jgi:hypothetical protein
VWWQVKQSIQVYTDRCLQQRLKHEAECSLGYRAGNAPVRKLSSAGFDKRKGERGISPRSVLDLLDVVELASVRAVRI